MRDLTRLERKFPNLGDFFTAVADTTYPDVPDLHLLDAMVRVVNSQMLSTKAATAIFQRIQALAKKRRLKYLANLTQEELRECGMSFGKIRSIHEFRSHYRKQPQHFERWRTLAFDELKAEVDTIWGISTWTAEMLAMFYFGHKDVFPTKDLAINKGVGLIRQHLDENFDPSQAEPFRTLLARCIWKSFEKDFWLGFE